MTAHSFAYEEDQYALDRLPAFDPTGLYRAAHQWPITSCGVVPTTVAPPVGQEPGAITATLVR